LQELPIDKVIKALDPLKQKVDNAVTQVQSLSSKATSLQSKVNSFPDQAATVDNKMQDVADMMNDLTDALSQVTQSLNAPVNLAHALTTDMQSFVDAAKALSSSLTATCSTVTSNSVFGMIETLNTWLAAEYCIDSSNICVGGNEVFPNTCDFTGNLCVGPYSLPQACLADVVTLNVCMVPKDLLSKTLCGTVPNECVTAPNPISATKCFSDAGINTEVCTDTNFASVILDKLEEYLPTWEVSLPFDGLDTDFTTADLLSVTEPSLAALDSAMKKLPDIIVNANYDGGKVSVVDNVEDGSQSITGSLGVIVPNADVFISDASVISACRTAIGHAFGMAFGTGLDASFVTVNLNHKYRRLADASLVATTVNIDYVINLPTTSVTSNTATQAQAVTVAQVFDSIQTDVKNVKGSDYSITVNPSSTMLVEDVFCGELVDVVSSADSSCDAFVAEASSPSNMACSGGAFSWSAQALTSFCDCPQKAQLCAALDHEIKCGTTPRGEACQNSGLAPTVPGQTFCSSILQCPTQYQAIEAVVQGLVATTTLAPTSTQQQIQQDGSTTLAPTSTQQGGDPSASTTAVATVSTTAAAPAASSASGLSEASLSSYIQPFSWVGVLVLHTLLAN
jgi:uncharacterized protein YoxC